MRMILEGLFCFLIFLGAILLSAWVVINFIMFAVDYYNRPKPVCHYNYVDANGVEGTGTMCQRVWDNVYCGNEKDAHLVVSFEKVCE